MFGMLWLAHGICRFVFHLPEAFAYVLMGIVFWTVGVGLAFLIDHKVEYATTPSCFAGGLMGCGAWGFMNNQQETAYTITLIGLLILFVNLYLRFIKKFQY